MIQRLCRATHYSIVPDRHHNYHADKENRARKTLASYSVPAEVITRWNASTGQMRVASLQIVLAAWAAQSAMPKGMELRDGDLTPRSWPFRKELDLLVTAVATPMRVL